MPAPIIPWQPSNIASEIQDELNRRKINRSFNFKANQTANWNQSGDWTKYQGPMTSWIRVCSNSEGHPAIAKPRFVFHGGKGFYQTYGFQPNQNGAKGSQLQIIGYTPDNPPVPHQIENSLVLRNGSVRQYPIHVPTPEISRLDVVTQKELYRRATIEWVCFSWEQLAYLTPYFLVPGISIMIEFGWNHFNPTSLVPLYDKVKMADFWRNAYPLYTDNVIKSKGNYDVVYGIVSNFNWSMDGNKIICTTEVTSKDRLYAGVSKDMGLTVNDNKDVDAPRPIFQSLRDFVTKDETMINLKNIAESIPGQEVTKLQGGEKQNVVWRDILRPLIFDGGPEVIGMRAPYIHGVFTGRPKKFYGNVDIGTPNKNDFDKTTSDKPDPTKTWINMGMIVEILNHFSTLDGGKGEPMFQVDIMNSVIGGHPNLISCDRNVLIPNRRAPKYHYGQVGINSYTGGTPPSDYETQFAIPIEVSNDGATPANSILKRVCWQGLVANNPYIKSNKITGVKVCYRSDLDTPINFLRYQFKDVKAANSQRPVFQSILQSFSFPAIEDVILPKSPSGLNGNVLEKDVSGLLSNIYLSYAAFRGIVDDIDIKTSSYVDIYKKILDVLMNAVDGFWDLVLVEVDNIMTITDRNYLGTAAKLKVNNPTYSFDYFDADSIIKSLKFKPILSDAQAMRAIYGETNNSGSKNVYVDKYDLLDYKFKDAIVMNPKDRAQGDTQSDLSKRITAKQQMEDLLRQIQSLSATENDDSLQMTIERDKKFGTTTQVVSSTPGIGSPGPTFLPTITITEGPKEYIKLVLPSSTGKQIFRLLIDDKDEDNNQRYCAVQPGITLELSLQGVGGLRTFQYFLVKNLPEPYSHKNIIFRITSVHHNMENGDWDTTITAGLLPLRNYIKKRLDPPPGGWAGTPTNPTIPPP
jgi:hypothetical protein